eukprot:TRINITY_DN29737_c0_g1_i1.p1 TRINITY_DN29737_c0_g1~~TRINITY_DN29737_c0_g1_i1.p1  ORF type:complete len:528 (+),score=84.52 TRINITY_DN29737_c0_g1_i1:212-1585(+)
MAVSSPTHRRRPAILRQGTTSAIAQWSNPTALDYSVSGNVEGHADRDIDLHSTVAHWPCFNLTVGVMILCNSAMIGLHTEYDEPVGSVIEHMFCWFFVAEMIVRMVWSPIYWRNAWNIVDAALVLLGIFDLYIAPVMPRSLIPTETVRALGVCRVLRLVRLFRLFPQLEVMVLAFTKALKANIMIFVCVFMINYIFSVFLTMQIGKNADQWGEHEEDIKKWFGTILNSVRTMFFIMTLSSWDEIIYVLMEKYEPGIIVFLVFFSYIIVTAYTLMSLLTGVICESLNTAQREIERMDVEVMKEEVKAQHSELVTRVDRLLSDLVEDGCETLTVAEVRQTLEVKCDVFAQLKSLQIDLEPHELFDLIGRLSSDRNSDEAPVKIKDVVHAMSHLVGNAKAYAVYDLQHVLSKVRRDVEELKGLKKDFASFGDKLSDIQRMLHDAHFKTAGNSSSSSTTTH